MTKTSKFRTYYEFMRTALLGLLMGKSFLTADSGHTRCKIKKCPVCCVLLEISIFAAV